MRISSLKKGTFPKNNLVNNKDNKSLYYYKVADEIIRQMKKDIFYKLPDSYLSIDISNYKINEDEVLIFESLLNKSYFDSIEDTKRKNILFNTTYDTSYPIIDNKYPYTKKLVQKAVDIDKIESKIRLLK